MRNDITTSNTTLAHERGMTDASRDFRTGPRRATSTITRLENRAPGYRSGYNRAWESLEMQAQMRGAKNGTA